MTERARAKEFLLNVDYDDIASLRHEAKRWKQVVDKYDQEIDKEIAAFNRVLDEINATQHPNFDELRLCVLALGYAYADHATALAAYKMLQSLAGDNQE